MVASDFRTVARGALRGNWGIALLVTLVAGILGASVGYGNSFSSATSSSAGTNTAERMDTLPPEVQAVTMGVLGAIAVVALIYLVIVIVIGGAVNLGLKQFNINLVRKDAPADFGTLFSKFNIFGKAFVLNLLMGIFIFLWTLLLIIPGIIAAYRYAMAPYIMAQNPNIGALEAINASKEMMKGNKWRLFCLHISFIGWALLAMLTCGIGMLWLNPYMAAAEASFYLSLTNQLPGFAAPPYEQQNQPGQPGPAGYNS